MRESGPFPLEEDLPVYAPRRRTVEVLRQTDTDGADICLVPVVRKNHQLAAKLFAKDWDVLMRWGISDNWHLNVHRSGHCYVVTSRTSIGGRYGDQAIIARLLMQAEPVTEFVKYRDGNPLNLRRDNLYVSTSSR